MTTKGADEHPTPPVSGCSCVTCMVAWHDARAHERPPQKKAITKLSDWRATRTT